MAIIHVQPARDEPVGRELVEFLLLLPCKLLRVFAAGGIEPGLEGKQAQRVRHSGHREGWRGV